MKKKLTTLILIIGIAALFNSCENDLAACMTISNSSPYVGDVVTFSDCSNGGGFLDSSDPANWVWNFGDGSSGTGSSASHTYTTSGSYTVTLTAKDADGDVTGTTNQTIIVKNPTGNVTFWTSSYVVQSYPIAVTVNGNTNYVTWNYIGTPACNSAYCANFNLPEGTYSYSAYSNVPWSGSGNFTIIKGQCLQIDL